MKIKITEKYFLPSVRFEPMTSGIRDQRHTHDHWSQMPDVVGSNPSEGRNIFLHF